MKILQIIFSLQSGGAERFVLDLSNELVKDNDVVLCTILKDDNSNRNFYKNEISKKVKYINLGSNSAFSLRSLNKMFKLIHKEKPDIVHCHLNVIPLVLLNLIFSRKIKLIHTLHNDADKTVTPVQKPLNKFLYKKNRISPITISSKSDISFKKYYKLENSTLINNGRSLGLKSKRFNDLKKQYSKTEHLFVHIGRFHPQKNQSMLIDAFNQLYTKYKNFKLLVIGYGFEAHNAKELIEKANPNIEFLGQKHNVIDYLSIADAFCLTSIYEGAPISLLEAISCGCVPICTPVGGIPDVVTNNISGLLSKNTETQSYLQTLEYFINNKGLIKKEDLIKTYYENYSMELCAKQYLNVYNE